MTAKLAIENLYKIFNSSDGEALELARQQVSREEILRRTGSVVAVDDVSFAVAEGEVFVVMGLSGSGKSTLVRCINRLFEPTSGAVLLDGEDVVQAAPAALRQIRLYRMAMVFQHFALLPHRTVLQNAEYGLKARGMGKAERREKALKALETVGLEAWVDAYPSSLSGGMQQRVGLARGMAVDPEVLLMDEPFSALDPLIRRDMQDELIQIQERQHATILFITHDLQEALKIGDRIAIMKDGRFVQIGSPEEIVTAPADDYVAAFTRDVDRSRVLTFKSIMGRALTVAPDMPLSEVRRFAADGAAGIFVASEAGRLLGLIGREQLAAADSGATAASVMREPAITVRGSQHLYEAFGQMGAGLPLAVVDSKGRLIGMADPAAVYQHLAGTAPIRGDERAEERTLQ